MAKVESRISFIGGTINLTVLQPSNFGPIASAELHHFSDASTQGYGQCLYLRLTNGKGRIHCSFVMGKARVTPLKAVTVPRLELTAAVVSKKTSAQLQPELDYKRSGGSILDGQQACAWLYCKQDQKIPDLCWQYSSANSTALFTRLAALRGYQVKPSW